MLTPPRTHRIAVPGRVAALLATNQQLNGSVLLTLGRFEKWLESNKVVFFREYTDHGPDHVNQVLATASSLINDESWNILRAGDAAVLVLSTLLHDAAMHLREDGFAWLVTHGQTAARAFEGRDLEWPELWRLFLGEATRFDSRKLHDLFDDDRPPRVPPLERLKMTDRDRLLIGEFLRRHHARLAHEIALHGVPGPSSSRLTFGDVDPVIADVSGLVARSHNLPIRTATDVLDKLDRRTKHGVHVPFIMAALRIADYVQVQAERAPGELLLVEGLRSPISRSEWLLHSTIESVHADDDDPEAIVIVARPTTVAEFAKATSLFRSMQQELDETWAVLGEIYGPRENLRKLGLTARRIKSNLDDRAVFARTVGYIPTPTTFTTAGSDLISLLVGPLYDYQPAFAVRELVQNAVDAVRERADYAASAGISESSAVVVELKDDNNGVSWLTVRDNGVGMTADTIINYFLRAGASFRRSEYWLSHHTDGRGHSRVLRSGRFGIGVLAAFLAGNQVEVTTRHVTALQGIVFTATLTDKYIELRNVACDVGTTIRVLLTKTAAQSLRDRPYSWDWYCLASPAVKRVIDGDVDEQEIDLPLAGAELRDSRRRIKAVEFRDVQWEYDPSYSVPKIVCNGIKVEDVEMDWRHESAELDPEIERPRISVFDPDGMLPLNLQRTRVHSWPFTEELVDDIICNIVAFVAIYGSAANPLDILTRKHAGMKRSSDRSTDVSWLCCTPKGWTLTHPVFLPEKVNRVALISADGSASGMCRAVDVGRSVVVAVRPTPDHDSGETPFECFEAAAFSDIGPRGLWRHRRVRGYKFTAFDDENEHIDGRMQSRRAMMRRRPNGEERFLHSVGEDFRPTVNFAMVENELRNDGSFVGLAEIALRRKSGKQVRPTKSSAVRSWLRHVVDGYIPFSDKQRKRLLRKSEIAAHAEMYSRPVNSTKD